MPTLLPWFHAILLFHGSRNRDFFFRKTLFLSNFYNVQLVRDSCMYCTVWVQLSSFQVWRKARSLILQRFPWGYCSCALARVLYGSTAQCDREHHFFSSMFRLYAICFYMCKITGIWEGWRGGGRAGEGAQTAETQVHSMCGTVALGLTSKLLHRTHILQRATGHRGSHH